MILYLDTSALMKLFIVEPGSESVGAAVAEASVVATHLITYAETRAALGRAVRMGRVDGPGLQALLAQFEDRWTSFEVLGVTEPLVRRAGDLAQRHGLRGYDSLHLAAALALRELVGSAVDLRFGAFDGQLRDAALTHGLAPLPGV